MSAIEEPPQRYLSDFIVGETFRGNGTTITDAHFLFFAALTGDNHPIHYDEVYAASRPMGKRLAHGLLLMSLTAVGATPLSPLIHDSLIAFVGQSCRFVGPATIGDTVHPEFTVCGIEGKDDNRGLLRIQVRLLKHPSTVLLEGEHVYLMRVSRDS
jgi:3-hydroxybutyryl-CoA dehydratase